MAQFDRQFDIVKPDWSYIIRECATPADMGLVNPVGTSPVPLVDGELVQFNASRQWIRATNAAVPAHFVLDERGDPVTQVARKLTAVLGGASFLCRTLVYDTALTTLYAAVGHGAVNNSLSGSLGRVGLIAVGGGYRMGFITSLASVASGNKLEVFITGL